MHIQKDELCYVLRSTVTDYVHAYHVRTCTGVITLQFVYTCYAVAYLQLVLVGGILLARSGRPGNCHEAIARAHVNNLVGSPEVVRQSVLFIKQQKGLAKPRIQYILGIVGGSS